MKVFEFLFNPKLKEDLIFDSFCYEPKNIYEKRLGNLYLLGLLKNVLPQNLHFLDKLTKVIQKEYYRSTVRKPEKALKESLKEANKFLEQIVKKGDVSWLGNLSFLALSLTPQQKFGRWELNFAKVDDWKIFLLRGKGVVDIERKLKFEEFQPWPLKIFGNIVSGKLAEGDILLISTQEIANFFEKEDLFNEIGKIWPVEEKKLKEIFDKKKEEILKFSGLCLIIVLTKETLLREKEVISPKSYPKEFNLKEIFTPPLKFLVGKLNSILKKISALANFLFSLTNLFQISQLRKKILALPYHKKLKLPKLATIKLPKSLILILALIFFLALGFFISQFQEKKEIEERQIILKEIQEKVNRAEGLLILKTPKAEKEANLLLKESWKEISQLPEIILNLSKNFQDQVFSLKNNIFKTLSELNKLEIIEEPELFFEFDQQEFIPQKMVFFEKELYFFSPYSQKIVTVNLDIKEKKFYSPLLDKGKGVYLAASLPETVLFFIKPDQLLILAKSDLTDFNLEKPYPDFSFSDFAALRNHLYFLEKNLGEIIRYPYLENLKWDSAELWLAQEEKKVMESRSLAVDDSIWLLNKNNSLSRYYTGRLQEKIVLEIFPEPKELKKIFTSPTLPYLYLSEPIQKRIIILNKKGEIIKQFQSEKFDNLWDFAVSQNGKTIWLLNGLKVYQLNAK